MNRDEAVSRPQETPPQAERHGFYPKDSLAFGTWCALSPQGTVYCLLNRYDDSDADIKPKASRGMIIPTLLSGEALPDYDNFGSFSLISLNLFGTIGSSSRTSTDLVTGTLTSWDGRGANETQISDVPYFFTSSSFRKAQVIPYRQKLFADFIADSPTPDERNIFAFHKKIDDKPEYGIFAERPDSHTKSVLQFTVRGKSPAHRSVLDFAAYRYFRRDGFHADGKVIF